ncbi:MAG TPA: polysaccharide biosynthesis protein, partial [Erysipelothrix sp.]|nr:polysaccharide biosynthesis protein [Erysipelothrix sp.]
MNKEVIKKYTVPVFDFYLIVNAYALSVLVKSDFNLVVFSQNFASHFSSILIALCVYIAFYILFKIRFTVWHLTSITEFVNIFSMNLVGAIILIALRFLNLLPGLSASVILTTTIFNTLFSFLARVLYRFGRVTYIQRLKTGKTERILIYGAGSAGRLITTEIVENKNYNYEVIGILDDDPKLKGSSLLRSPILGGLDIAEKVIKEKMIDTVIVAMPSVEKQKRQHILQTLTPLDVEIKVVSSAKRLLEGFDFRQTLRKVNVLDLLGRQEIVIDDEEIEHMLKDKVVLVTGAGGSIGSELVHQIVNRSAKQVILLDFNETGVYGLEQELKIQMREGTIPMVKIVPLIRSIRDYNGLEYVFSEYKPDYVYHAAAHKHV